jgi:hypothetical protein
VKEIFLSLMKQIKWIKYKQNVQVEDVMFRRDERATGQTHKYARIVKVHKRDRWTGSVCGNQN